MANSEAKSKESTTDFKKKYGDYRTTVQKRKYDISNLHLKLVTPIIYNKGQVSMGEVYTGEASRYDRLSTAGCNAVPPQTERRRERRQSIRETVETSFYNNRELFHASLVDLSSGGASMHLDIRSAENVPELYTGRNMECYFSTPNGRSKCRGTVRWVQKNSYGLTWGLSFIELSPDGEDPLRAVITEVGQHPVLSA
jgi:hypothetical protein